MKIIAIANQKGGVGKTTTAVNLAACLARAGYRALLLDLDPQCNATTHAGATVPDDEKLSSYALISEKTPDWQSILCPVGPNLALVPAHIALAEIDIRLFSVINREQRLKNALATVENDFDFAVIDCPPSLSITTINALCAATHVIIAVQTNGFAYEALKRLMAIVADVRDESNPELITYALATMHRKNVNINQDVLAQVKEDFLELTLESVIPFTATLVEASVAQQAICDYADGSKAHLAYSALTEELIARVHRQETQIRAEA